MKNLSQDESDAACRIFRHVNKLAGQYYPRKTTDQIIGYVSSNKWIMFPEISVGSIEEGKEIPYPNIYNSFFDQEVVDNGKGQIKGYIGLTYHNVPAMNWLKQILRIPSRSTKFISILKNFGDEWEIGIHHKTKVDHEKTIPRYKEFETTKPSIVTAKYLHKTIKESDNFLYYPGDLHDNDGHPVLWDVTVFTVRKETNVNTFDDDIRKVFELFIKALSLKNSI